MATPSTVPFSTQYTLVLLIKCNYYLTLYYMSQHNGLYFVDIRVFRVTGISVSAFLIVMYLIFLKISNLNHSYELSFCPIWCFKSWHNMSYFSNMSSNFKIDYGNTICMVFLIFHYILKLFYYCVFLINKLV